MLCDISSYNQGNNTEEYCSCGCNKASYKGVPVEYLFPDINTCNRCIGTGAVLDEVVKMLTPALSFAGYGLYIIKQ